MDVAVAGERQTNRPDGGGRRLQWRRLCASSSEFVLSENALPNFANNYNRELAKSGLWSLFAAFRANRLDYEQFYPTMPRTAAFHRVRKILAKDGSRFARVPTEEDLLRYVSNRGPEKKLNVIQITVESLSASFMARYGSRENITPNLDALVPRGARIRRMLRHGKQDRPRHGGSHPVRAAHARALVGQAAR
jgi:hypothetical protein